jgi:hypothetical protein
MLYPYGCNASAAANGEAAPAALEVVAADERDYLLVNCRAETPFLIISANCCVNAD